LAAYIIDNLKNIEVKSALLGKLVGMPGCVPSIYLCWLLFIDDLKNIEVKSALLGKLVGMPGCVPSIYLWSSVRHLFQTLSIDPQVGFSSADNPMLTELACIMDNLVRALPLAQDRVAQLETDKAD
jgi:hypothetical protein